MTSTAGFAALLSLLAPGSSDVAELDPALEPQRSYFGAYRSFESRPEGERDAELAELQQKLGAAPTSPVPCARRRREPTR